jgi:hypothetical protein
MIETMFVTPSSQSLLGVASDLRLRGKWVSLWTLEVALKQRYGFGDNLKLTSILMSKVMTTLVTDIDSMQQSRAMGGMLHRQEKED